MSIDPFPEHIDPYKLFARKGSWRGEIPLSRLVRLNDYLVNSGGNVAVQLKFSHDDNHRRRVTGTVAARLTVQCQRCLKNLELDLHSSLDVRVVSGDDEARDLPVEMEAVTTNDGLDLLAVVEDELILSLPLAPHHAGGQCGRPDGVPASPARRPARENPFAVLKKLRTEQ